MIQNKETIPPSTMEGQGMQEDSWARNTHFLERTRDMKKDFG
jgi:hypothetical protein